jgi:hypothetical protein
MRPYKGYIKDDPNFKKLFENTVMLVGHVFESSYCYNKLTHEEFAIFRFNNDPTCALVGQNNDWCLIGGDILVLRTWVDNTLRTFDGIKDIFDLKALDAYLVQILTDPWTEQFSIWQLEIDLTRSAARPTTLHKIKDFKDYLDKPFTDKVEW